MRPTKTTKDEGLEGDKTLYGSKRASLPEA